MHVPSVARLAHAIEELGVDRSFGSLGDGAPAGRRLFVLSGVERGVEVLAGASHALVLRVAHRGKRVEGRTVVVQDRRVVLHGVDVAKGVLDDLQGLVDVPLGDEL